MLAALERGFDKYRGGVELRRDLRDVADHVARVVERGCVRELLQNALTVTAALVGQRQDEEMRSLTEASPAQNEEVNGSPRGRPFCRTHPDRHHPRHELRHHARAAPAAGVPDGGVPHDRHGRPWASMGVVLYLV